MILGDNIRMLRTEKGWTQVYLADRLQITAPFLAQIESGKRGMSLEIIEAISEVFEIPIASLFIDPVSKHQSKRSDIRAIEIQTIEKQLQKNITEDITKAFDKLK